MKYSYSRASYKSGNELEVHVAIWINFLNINLKD